MFSAAVSLVYQTTPWLQGRLNKAQRQWHPTHIMKQLDRLSTDYILLRPFLRPIVMGYSTSLRLLDVLLIKPIGRCRRWALSILTSPLKEKLMELVYAFAAMIVVCTMVLVRFGLLAIMQCCSIFISMIGSRKNSGNRMPSGSIPERRPERQSSPPPPRDIPSPTFSERMSDYARPISSPTGSMKLRRESFRATSPERLYKSMRSDGKQMQQQRYPHVRDIFGEEE